MRSRVIHAVRTATPPPIRSLRPDVAPELEEIVSRTMVREPQRSVDHRG